MVEPFEPAITTAERDVKAAHLRAEGKTYEYIATVLGYSDRSHCRKGIRRAITATLQEAGDEIRALEVERLNRLLDKAWQIMETPHYAHSAGRLITMDDDDGAARPLIDDAPALQALDRILKIMERRAKLLGLDAPAQVEVLTIDAIDAEIRRMDAQLAGRVAAGEAGRATGEAASAEAPGDARTGPAEPATPV